MTTVAVRIVRGAVRIVRGTVGRRRTVGRLRRLGRSRSSLLGATVASVPLNVEPVEVKVINELGELFAFLVVGDDGLNHVYCFVVEFRQESGVVGFSLCNLDFEVVVGSLESVVALRAEGLKACLKLSIKSLEGFADTVLKCMNVYLVLLFGFSDAGVVS